MQFKKTATIVLAATMIVTSFSFNTVSASETAEAVDQVKQIENTESERTAETAQSDFGITHVILDDSNMLDENNQAIVVGYTGDTPEKAELNVKNTKTGENISINSCKISSSGLLFEVSSGLDDYELIDLSIYNNEIATKFDMKKMGFDKDKPDAYLDENEIQVENYSDLENYAYDLYVNHFADESHWLIVYSTPDGYSSSDGFEDWYWEGMQGNDTDDVLTKSVTNSFNDELQKNLTARTRYTVSSAISTSFDDLTPTVMKSKVNWTMLFTSIAILAFVCLHACLMIGINPKARKYAKAKPCSDAAQEKACEYCGYTYVVDTCTECPHCGAPIPPEDQPGARFT